MFSSIRLQDLGESRESVDVCFSHKTQRYLSVRLIALRFLYKWFNPEQNFVGFINNIKLKFKKMQNIKGSLHCVNILTETMTNFSYVRDLKSYLKYYFPNFYLFE